MPPYEKDEVVEGKGDLPAGWFDMDLVRSLAWARDDLKRGLRWTVGWEV